jgi:hypothetical protein
MNPISRIAAVTDAEAAQMVHPDTLADLAQRLTSTRVEAAVAEDMAGDSAWRSTAWSRDWPAAGLARRIAGMRRWPGWLAPVAAAAAVAGVIIASLAVSGLILRPGRSGPAAPSSVFAKVPRYFTAIPEVPGRAVMVGATATGAELGTIAPPRPHTFFAWVAAAGDGRTFVLAAGAPPAPGTSAFDWGPIRFYRLVLDRSGRPGRLAPLPIPPETAAISGLALSPDGRKLAVSLRPAHGELGSKIQVFSLAAGAAREWAWPGPGTIGRIDLAPGSSPGAWEADSRTLLFQVTARARNGWPGQLRLLDTAAPAGSLLAASTRIPVPADEVGWQHNNTKHRITGIPLITGDGTKLVAAFFHASAPPRVFGFTITEFSVRTGKPVGVLYRRRTASEAGDAGVWWVNGPGNAVIAARGSVFGVQTPARFVPFPPRTQRLLVRHDGGLSLLPAW